MHMRDDNAKTNPRLGTARELLLEAIRNHSFPGCAYGVLARGSVIACEGLGRFTYEPDAPRVEAETIFDVASLTKIASTTAMAMMLYERGKLDLEMHLGELLPGFVVGRADSQWARAVTIRHLLSHSSGLPGYRPLFREARSPAELLRVSLALPLEVAPGTRAEYSDHGFILLGKALEVLAQDSLNRWTRREIFAPLGMDSTIFCPSESMRASIPPTEEDHAFRHRVVQGEVQDEHAFVLGGVAGHAGLFSTVPDLLRFSTAILTPEEAPLFSYPTILTFSERQLPVGSSRALGWDTPSAPSSSGTHFSTRSIGHLGYSGCSLWIDLEANVAVVLLTNRTWPDRSNDEIRQLRPAFHDAVRNALGF
jgi:CubicO group peptidase (beta-lactamase class C family)